MSRLLIFRPLTSTFLFFQPSKRFSTLSTIFPIQFSSFPTSTSRHLSTSTTNQSNLSQNDAKSEIILFEQRSPRRIRALFFLVSLQTFYWGYIGVESYFFPLNIEKIHPMIESSPYQQTFYNFVMHPFWTVCGVSFTAILWAFLLTFSKRFVSQISLVDGGMKNFKGNEMLACRTYSIFGNKTEPLKLKRSDISVMLNNSNSQATYVRFNVQGKRFNYLVDRKGTFLGQCDVYEEDNDSKEVRTKKRDVERRFLSYLGFETFSEEFNEYKKKFEADNVKVGEELDPLLPNAQTQRKR